MLYMNPSTRCDPKESEDKEGRSVPPHFSLWGKQGIIVLFSTFASWWKPHTNIYGVFMCAVSCTHVSLNQSSKHASTCSGDICFSLSLKTLSDMWIVCLKCVYEREVYRVEADDKSTRTPQLFVTVHTIYISAYLSCFLSRQLWWVWVTSPMGHCWVFGERNTTVLKKEAVKESKIICGITRI